MDAPCTSGCSPSCIVRISLHRRFFDCNHFYADEPKRVPVARTNGVRGYIVSCANIGQRSPFIAQGLSIVLRFLLPWILKLCSFEYIGYHYLSLGSHNPPKPLEIHRRRPLTMSSCVVIAKGNVSDNVTPSVDTYAQLLNSLTSVLF